MEFIGRAMGSLALIGFIGTILNFVGKRYHNKRKKNGKNSGGFDNFLLKVFVKNHKIWGFITCFALIAHAILQTYQYGFVWSGVITAVLMLVQILLGYSLSKNPNKKTLKIHRSMVILLLVFLATHLIHTEYYFFS